MRLSPGRFRLYAIGLFLLGIGQIIHAGRFAYWDWGDFAYGARHAGSPSLLTPANVNESFVYMPGAAFILAPLRDLTLAEGFWVNAVTMLCALVGAAYLARQIYALPLSFCLGMIGAWAPSTYAVVIGQSTPLGLLLTFLSLQGSIRGSLFLTALPIGLLLYKPTYAVPLVSIMILRGRFRELAIVALCGAGWYLASVAATGGNWLWPIALQRLEHRWFPVDLAYNGEKSVGLSPMLLYRGVSGAIVATLAVFLIAISVNALRRAPDRELYAAACLLFLVVSPHAWSYDAVLALPMIFTLIIDCKEPVRTRIVCAAYALAPGLLLAHAIHFNLFAVVVCGGFIGWLVVRSKPPIPRASRA